MVRDQKNITLMLLINKTVMLIVTGNTLGFFTESGNVIPFSINLTDFCRCFRVESKSTIQIFIGHDVFLINELHNDVKRYRFFLKFWPQFDITSSCGRKIE